MHIEHPQSWYTPRLHLVPHLQKDIVSPGAGHQVPLSARSYVEQTELLAGGAELTSGIFAAGTIIDTPDGEWLVEQLAQGDEIRCFKNGRLRVQSCVALPDHCIPDRVLRIRAGYLDATADLITLPHQLVRLNHWLGSALFGTKFPFVAANCVCLENKIEFISKPETQFFKLDLGICDALKANGVMCVSYSSPAMSSDEKQIFHKRFDYRELNSDEIAQALSAGSFFRKIRGKK